MGRTQRTASSLQTNARSSYPIKKLGCGVSEGGSENGLSNQPFVFGGLNFMSSSSLCRIGFE